MLIHELSNIVHEKSKLEFRKFGYTLGVFLLGLGLIFSLLSYQSASVVIVAGVILLVLGLLLPIFLRPFYIIWMSFAIVMGFIMTRLILTVIYYFVFFPVAMLMRVLRKELLEQKLDPESESYWRLRESKPYDPKQSENQY